MRSNLEPLIDKLFEEDELFVQDFEDAGLNCVLFIRKMGIHVEVSNKLSVNHNEIAPHMYDLYTLHCNINTIDITHHNQQQQTRVRIAYLFLITSIGHVNKITQVKRRALFGQCRSGMHMSGLSFTD